MSFSIASMTDQTLLQPFLAKPVIKTSSSESVLGLLLRLFVVFLVGVISLWANNEATKGFSINIINEAKHTSSGKRLALFFESDDTAIRVLLDTSFFVERYLYYGVPHRLRKPVNHITIKFSEEGERFSVTSGTSHGAYVIRLSSSLMEISDFRNAVKTALRCSMVRVWLWGGHEPELVAGMVEYLVKVRSFDEYGEDKEFVSVAKWLGYCEGEREGFIRRLNHEMRLGWDNRTVELASYGACSSRKVMLRDWF